MRAYLEAMERATYRAAAAARAAPLVLAALGRQMLELAARAHRRRPSLPRHARAHGRARAVLGAGPLLAPEQAVVVETDATRCPRDRAARISLCYLTLPNYVNNFREMGFADADLAGGGSDRLVDALVAWGDVDAVAERVRAHQAAGADHVAIQAIATEPGRALDDLRVLAPALLR